MAIKDHIEAIQQEMKEKYGMNARVDINVFTASPGRDHSFENALNVISQLQPEINSDIKIGHGGETSWVNIEDIDKQQEITIFYAREAI